MKKQLISYNHIIATFSLIITLFSYIVFFRESSIHGSIVINSGISSSYLRLIIITRPPIHCLFGVLPMHVPYKHYKVQIFGSYPRAF
jgi:hypothetical protein